MPAFHLILRDGSPDEPRRVDFTAESPDHAFQVACNEPEGIHIELWQADRLLARMEKEDGQLWKLLPSEAADGDEPATSAKIARPDLDAFGRLARDDARA